MRRTPLRFITLCALTLSLAGMTALFSSAAYPTTGQSAATVLKSSDLQRWMSGDLLAYLAFELNNHPRFKGRKLQLKTDADNQLALALDNTLRTLLLDIDGLQLLPEFTPGGFAPNGFNSIDKLVCTNPLEVDYFLRLTLTGGERAGVRLSIEDAASGATLSGFGRHWQGRLSRFERRLQRRPGASPHTAGSTQQPYHSSQPQLAAQHLVTAIACQLRVQIEDVTPVYWQMPPASSAGFDKTLAIARHYLHSFREFSRAQGPGEAQILLQPEELPLGDNVHQLWLAGLSAGGQPLPGINAVTYMAMADRSVAAMQQHRTQLPAQIPPSRQAAAAPAGDPQRALQVEVVDIEHRDSRHQRADLHLSLRIHNPSQRTIDYAFKMSGGYFIGCRPHNRHYRHQRFGTLRETIGPGETQVEELVIRDLQHRPGRGQPAPRCAGVVDLDGFEQFTQRGNKVVDYVEWSL